MFMLRKSITYVIYIWFKKNRGSEELMLRRRIRMERQMLDSIKSIKRNQIEDLIKTLG